MAAQRAIRSAQVVAYPVADLAREGMAARIAAPWLQPEQQRLPLLFPMVEAAAPRRQAWHAAADAVVTKLLEAGAQPRKALPLDELRVKLEPENVKLREMGEPPLIEEEAYGARL